MLLRFSTDNFRNFADGFELSMKPKPSQSDLSFSLLSTEAAERTYRALSSGVIFGPNSAGKSNILSAVDTFRQIVLRGNVKNVSDATGLASANVPGGRLELIPHRYLPTPKPVSFEIEFVAEKIHFEYGFSADIGLFLDLRFPRRVLRESLKVDGNEVFVYDKGRYAFASIEDIPDETWGDDVGDRSLRAELAAKMAGMCPAADLFLMNAFRTILSPKLAEVIREWLSNRLIVLWTAQQAMLLPTEAATRRGETSGFKTDDILSQIVSTISPNTDGAGHLFRDGFPPRLGVELSPAGSAPGCSGLPAEAYESSGTVRLLRILPRMVDALKNGRTLLMDDFDVSIHPYLAQEIISMFHNDEMNTHGAQLIVTTHNVVHMSSSLYRRD